MFRDTNDFIYWKIDFNRKIVAIHMEHILEILCVEISLFGKMPNTNVFTI